MSKQRTLANHILFNPFTDKQKEYKRAYLAGELGSYKINNFDVRNIIKEFPRYLVKDFENY